MLASDLVRTMAATQRLGNNPESTGTISGVSLTADDVREMTARIKLERAIVNGKKRW